MSKHYCLDQMFITPAEFKTGLLSDLGFGRSRAYGTVQIASAIINNQLLSKSTSLCEEVGRLREHYLQLRSRLLQRRPVWEEKYDTKRAVYRVQDLNVDIKSETINNNPAWRSCRRPMFLYGRSTLPVRFFWSRRERGAFSAVRVTAPQVWNSLSLDIKLPLPSTVSINTELET